ncbi:MAG: vitamin B12 dependent methionine synthase [Dehalococcoidia bacterium]|nr:vitamin B12 dependent methionine synthase [Dehalococcoidia bacterium]
MKILDDIPVHLDVEQVLKELHLNERKEQFDVVRKLVEIANSVIQPKVIYEISYVDNKNEDRVDIGGIKFTSRVLRINLDKVGKVFPFIMTIGKELEDRMASFDNLLEQYYLDEIGNVALGLIGNYLEEHLKREYRMGQLSSMYPGMGDLQDWPIAQQEQLFSLFGNVEELIGVKLTPSMLMIPRKSESGIYFPTEVEFLSCQICSRERCKERHAPYNKELAESYRGK